MRPFLSLLAELSDRLDLRSRRILLVVSTAGIVLFARTTVAAFQDGALPGVVAGAVLLGAFAIAAAVASTHTTAPRRS
jgi:ABC-type glucose/galactose transport system permease subunit